MRWIRRLAPAAIATLLTVASTAPTQAGGGPIPVRTSNAWEFAPAADSDGVNEYVAWTQNSNQSPRHVNVYVSTNGGGKVRVNPEGTEAFTGGLDGATLIYQRRPNGGNDSDLKLYDLSSDTPSNPPAGVNNDRWQWAPTFSDPWILYGENRFNGPDAPWRVYLFNVDTLERRLLDEVRNRCGCIWPGQVQGNYATWTVCKERCDVYIHEIGSQTTNVVANPGPKHQYFGGVTSNGLVYLARSGNACGASVRIVGVPYQSGSGDTIYALPDNREIDFSIYVYDDAIGTGPEVYFSRFACTRNGQGDIYVIADAFTPTHPASTERNQTREPARSWGKPLPEPEAASPW